MLACVAVTLCFPALPDRSDVSVAEEIRARFAKSKISTNHFQVTVSKGVATLTGKTDVVQHKGTATRIARSCGAREVVNKIEIGAAAREKLAERLSAARATSHIARPVRHP
jgi:osmotically-inducible protein OsmY